LRLGAVLLFFASYGHLLGLLPSTLQEVPSTDVGVCWEWRMSISTHVRLYRVTPHAKAMEDAVEIGLRSAFNEVGFASFNKVLPGLKLKGEHL